MQREEKEIRRNQYLKTTLTMNDLYVLKGLRECPPVSHDNLGHLPPYLLYHLTDTCTLFQCCLPYPFQYTCERSRPGQC